MSDVLERLLEHSVILSNAFSNLPGTPLVFGHQGGGLIQEGVDKIDINTETVDGKNTFHSMARAVFRIRHYAVDPNISQSKKKRSQERYVQISNSASSLTACLVFSKPKTRGVRGRIENALTG
jgi:hypothetical protein